MKNIVKCYAKVKTTIILYINKLINWPLSPTSSNCDPGIGINIFLYSEATHLQKNICLAVTHLRKVTDKSKIGS